MPIALIDVDGVLADTTQHIIDMVVPEMDISQATSFEFEKWLSPEKALGARAIMKTPEFWLTLPVKKGAKEGLQKLHDRNYEVVILTRGYGDCPTWLACRETWLNDNFGIHHNDIMTGARKYLVGGDLFIDDKRENIEKWEKANHGRGRAWLMDAPYNQDFVRTQRLTWDTIEFAL